MKVKAIQVMKLIVQVIFDNLLVISKIVEEANLEQNAEVGTVEAN